MLKEVLPSIRRTGSYHQVAPQQKPRSDFILNHWAKFEKITRIDKGRMCYTSRRTPKESDFTVQAARLVEPKSEVEAFQIRDEDLVKGLRHTKIISLRRNLENLFHQLLSFLYKCQIHSKIQIIFVKLELSKLHNLSNRLIKDSISSSYFSFVSK